MEVVSIVFFGFLVFAIIAYIVVKRPGLLPAFEVWKSTLKSYSVKQFPRTENKWIRGKMSVAHLIYRVEVNCGREGLLINNYLSPEFAKILLPWEDVGAIKILVTKDGVWAEFHLSTENEIRRCVVSWDRAYDETARQFTGLSMEEWGK